MNVGGTLRCTSAHQIFLLLQASDVILHDLYHALEKCEVDEVTREEEMRGNGREREEKSTNEKEEIKEKEKEEKKREDRKCESSEGEYEEEDMKKESLLPIPFFLILRKWSNLHPGSSSLHSPSLSFLKNTRRSRVPMLCLFANPLRDLPKRPHKLLSFPC